MNDEAGMALRSYGRSSISRFLGDFIVYRSLNPCDPRLPGFAESSAVLGLPAGRLPRKHEPGYAKVVVYQLQAARQLSRPGASLKRLLYLGDTRLSDATAFYNLCRAGGWEGLAFICSEDPRQPAALAAEDNPDKSLQNSRLFISNRWSLLGEFDRQRQAAGFEVDEETVAVIDLDKTALGARGRNAGVIDQARQLAVQVTVADLLGEDFDPALFQQAYAALDKPEFHTFTQDNQDYLAYTCLAIGSGRCSLVSLLTKVRSGELAGFEPFISGLNTELAALPENFRALHRDFYAQMQAGDPTPFKAFRRSEYRLTAARLGCLPHGAPVPQILVEEITVTWEVHRAALEWKKAGALIFGLSDKPDEASLPTPELAQQGALPLHRIETHLIGA